MVHVTAIITPSVPPEVVGEVGSLVTATTLPEVYGRPKGAGTTRGSWPGAARLPGGSG